MSAPARAVALSPSPAIPEIIVATLSRPTGATGVQTHFNAFLAYLHGRGLQPVLLTPFSYMRPLATVVFAVRVVFGRLSPAFSVWWYEQWHCAFLRRALRARLRRSGPLVVYAQCPLSARAALEERVRPDQRVVLAAHFNKSIADEWVGLLGLRKGRLYRRILARDREVIARLDGIVYVSEFARRIVETETPAATRVKSAVIPNFVSAAPDNSGAPAAGDLVTIGTLEPRKNHAYLLRVLAAARTRGKVYRLTIIGDGPSRPELEALAEQLGVAGQVRFLGVQPDARRLLKGHRVYVHSSLMESFGIVLIEAMAAGLPLCAAPTGGVPDVFDHGQEGFYWPLDDPDEGARLLMTLSEDADLRRRMSDAARRRFHRQFEVGAAAAGLLDFLGSIATGAPPRVVRET